MAELPTELNFQAALLCLLLLLQQNEQIHAFQHTNSPQGKFSKSLAENVLTTSLAF
jgi:hypothetical protein